MSKLVKLWENKNAQRAVKGAGLSLMALSLAACGGSSDPATPVDITSDNADAILTALQAVVSSASTAQDVYDAGETAGAAASTTAAVSAALKDFAAARGVTGYETMTDSQILDAIQNSDDAAAISDAVSAATGGAFTSLSALYDAYNALANPTTPANFALTASTTDSYPGTATANIITGNQITFQATDTIEGGAGADALQITNSGTAGFSITPAVLNNVETIQVTSIGGGATTINLVVASGVTDVISKNSTSNDSFTNIQSAATLTIDGSTNDVTATYLNSLMSGTADAASVVVTGGANVGTITVEGATATNVVETLNISSTGTTANAIDTVASNSAAVATVNVTGSANLTLGTGTAFATGDFAATTINATNFSGNLTAYVDGANTSTKTVIGGAGNDTIYLDGVDTFFAADNGNGATNPVTSIVGGAGNDTLVIDGSLIASQLVTTTANTADNVLSGVETISVIASGASGSAGTPDVTLDASVSADVTAVSMALTNSTSTGSTANVFTGEITNIKAQAVSATGAIGSHATAEVDIEFTKYDGSGANDSQAVSLGGAFKTVTFNDATDDSATTAVETGGVENVAIAASANLTVDSLVAAKAFGVTLSGSKNITVSAANLGTTNTTNAATTDDLVTVNAGSLTGSLDFTKSEAGVYSITAGSGTNSIRLGVVGDNTTVTGGAGTDTVYLLDEASSSETINVTTTGVEVVSITTVASGTDTFDLAAVSAGTTVKMSAGYAAALTNINGQTIEVVTAEAASGGALTNNTNDTTWGSTILTAGLKAGETGASFKISGDAETATDASSYAGTIKTAGVATINNATVGGTYSLDLTVDLDAISSTNKLTGIVLTGGGAKSASANSTITVATDDSNVNITSLDATGYTGNVDASSMNFDSSTTAATISLAATQDITLAAAELARDLVSISGGAGANTVIAAGVGAADLRMSSSSVETYNLTMLDDASGTLAATTIDFRDTTGVTNVKLGIAADTSSTNTGDIDETLTLSNLATGATVSFGGVDTDGTRYGIASGDTTTIDAAVSGATSLNLNNLGGAGNVSVYDLNLGSTYTSLNIDGVVASKSFTLTDVAGSGLTSITVENNTTASAGAVVVSAFTAAATQSLTVDSSKGAVTLSDLGTMNSLETLTVNTGVAAGGGKTTISAGTSTSIDTITASGTGAFEITALTASSLDSINASGVTGAVTIGSSSAAITTAAGATITTGTGNDTITMSTTASLGLTAGEATGDNDTLILVGAQNSGTGVIDLNAAGDQLTNLNGFADATVQTGFESVNLSAVTSSGSYGFAVTANAAGSTITGSAYNDTITLGAGADDVVVAATASANGVDTITGFTAGTDDIDWTALTDTALTAITASTGTGHTLAAGDVMLFASSTAGDADSAAAAATKIDSLLDNGGTLTDASTGDVLFFIITDDNSSALYQYTTTSGETGVTSTELQLMATVDAVLTSVDIIL